MNVNTLSHGVAEFSRMKHARNESEFALIANGKFGITASHDSLSVKTIIPGVNETHYTVFRTRFNIRQGLIVPERTTIWFALDDQLYFAQYSDFNPETGEVIFAGASEITGERYDHKDAVLPTFTSRADMPIFADYEATMRMYLTQIDPFQEGVLRDETISQHPILAKR